MRFRATFSILTAVAATGLVTSVEAGSIDVDGIGGAVRMKSKAIDGVFDAASPNFSNAALDAVHADLHASGINTDGVVTFLAADTDDGLSFMALVDDNTQGTGEADFDSQLSMVSSAPDTASHYINDRNQDIGLFFGSGNGTKSAAGEFTWDSDRYGDAFAWAALDTGDFASFNFFRGGSEFDSFPGLAGDDTFQFVSWNGESWEIVATSEFSGAGQFAFSFTVIPLPAPVLMGAAGLGLVAWRRRKATA